MQKRNTTKTARIEKLIEVMNIAKHMILLFKL